MNVSRDVFRSAVLTLSAGAMLLMPSGHAWQQAQPMGSMPGMSGKTTVVDGHVCDDMGSSTHGMSVMGQSMAAMTNHMCITPMRPQQPGDEERAKHEGVCSPFCGRRKTCGASYPRARCSASLIRNNTPIATK